MGLDVRRQLLPLLFVAAHAAAAMSSEVSSVAGNTLLDHSVVDGVAQAKKWNKTIFAPMSLVYVGGEYLPSSRFATRFKDHTTQTGSLAEEKLAVKLSAPFFVRPKLILGGNAFYRTQRYQKTDVKDYACKKECVYALPGQTYPSPPNDADTHYFMATLSATTFGKLWEKKSVFVFSLSSDGTDYHFCEKTTFNATVIATLRDDDVVSSSLGLVGLASYNGYRFSGMGMPLFMYVRQLSPRFSLDLALPASYSLRYRAAARDRLSVGCYMASDINYGYETNQASGRRMTFSFSQSQVRPELLWEHASSLGFRYSVHAGVECDIVAGYKPNNQRMYDSYITSKHSHLFHSFCGVSVSYMPPFKKKAEGGDKAK